MAVVIKKPIHSKAQLYSAEGDEDDREKTTATALKELKSASA